MKLSFKLRSLTQRTVLLSGIMLAVPAASGLFASEPSASVQSGMETAATPLQYEGVIIDANTQEPIIGATVKVKDNPSIMGTVTDMDGKFRIKASPGEVLVISYVGYQTKEVKLAKITLLNIELAEDAKSLEEVVVTAFNVGQKKESVVGSITQVRPAELKVPSANLSNSFAGRLSGVISYQRSGEPGADGSTFYIRGISTINGSARSPLIIIDGVEASQGDLNALDSEVIESFSILKDATATAMYGTRGANGVMIVTTKSGANMEKAAITARVEGYVAMPTYELDFADPITYMNLYNEAVNNYGSGVQLYSEDKIRGTMQGLDPIMYPNVNWMDEIFKNSAFNQRVNFNIRGGSKRIDYFMNANFVHETGMLRNRSQEFYSYKNNIDIKRYTLQTNLNIHLTPTATVSMNLGAELRDTGGPVVSTADLYARIVNSNPVDFPILFPTSSFVGKEGTTSDFWKWGVYGGGNAESADNPMAMLTKGYSSGFESTVRANVRYNQKLDFLTKGLSFGALISFKNWSSTSVDRSQGYNKYTYKDVVRDAEGNVTNYIISPNGNEQQYTLGTSSSSTGDRSYYVQLTLNYDRTFNSDHNVSAMVLYNQDEYSTNAPGTDLIASLPKRKQGLAARASYDYKHRYMVEFNMGYNGSENFAEGHRFGFFPSIGWGYNISEEPYFDKLKNVIHRLKFRGSYGLVGNADAGTRFLYMPVVTLQGTSGFQTGDGETFSGSLQGPTYTRFENKDISWEVGYKLNLGLDVGLFNCLDLGFDYFRELRKDIFQQNLTVPNYMGTSNSQIYGNYGEVLNTGFEITADYGKQINKNLSIQFKGTFSYAHNTVRKYAEGFNPLYPNLSIIGHSLNTYTGYLYAGHLFMDQAEIDASPTTGGVIAPGDIKYVDIPNVNGETDGVINDQDKVYMGHPTVPEIIYGFGPSVKWKNWDFSVFFQGVARTSLMMSESGKVNFHPFGADKGRTNRNVLQFIADDHWSPDNQNIYAAYPRLTYSPSDNNQANSDYWLRNAAFLKLKNAEIGYTWKFLRAYVSGTNLLTFSPFKYWDPEMGGGTAFVQYPTQRTINFGVQFNL